jgi:hypothetical protein
MFREQRPPGFADNGANIFLTRGREHHATGRFFTWIATLTTQAMAGGNRTISILFFHFLVFQIAKKIRISG